jgi:hypothetical protein
VTSKKSPSDVAKSIIEKFPGSSLTTKTGSLLTAASITAWMSSKEVYVFDGINYLIMEVYS